MSYKHNSSEFGNNFFVYDKTGHVYEIFLPEEYASYYQKNNTSQLFNSWQTELFIMNQYKDKVKQFHENLISTDVEEFFQTYADFDKGNAPSEGFKDYIDMVDRYRKQRIRVEAVRCALKECQDEESVTDEML